MGAVLTNFLYLIVLALWILIFARVIMSWVAPRGGGGFVAVVYQLTEPILGPIRRILPATGGIDFAPFVAIIILGLLMRILGAR